MIRWLAASTSSCSWPFCSRKSCCCARTLRAQQPVVPSILGSQPLPSSVDHGSPAIRHAVRLGAPWKLPLQLSIWIFIAPKSDVYEKVVFRFDKSSPALRFAICAIAVASRAKNCEKRRILARLDLRLHGYCSHRKSENGSWFCAWFSINCVYITFFYNKYPNT